ncbi:MAG: methyltransferase domain-containing protein [Chthonomonadales bacterium]
MSEFNKYVLNTGSEAARRLAVVNEVHGADTRDALKLAGLSEGMRVADFGCGVGILSRYMAEHVGATGTVIGIDASEDQVAESQRQSAQLGVTNTHFQRGDAAESGLPDNSFDFVFSRFVLMHMAAPHLAIREMIRVLKPSGTLLVEDGDFSSPFSYPDSPAYRRCFDLYRIAVRIHGADPLIGRELYSMVRGEGLADVQVRLVQPVVTTGEAKRLPEWTLEECGPFLIERKLTSAEELNAIGVQLDRLALDDNVLVGMARVSQVWGTKLA